MDITLINPPENLRVWAESQSTCSMEYTVSHHLVLCIYKRLLKKIFLYCRDS